MSDNTHISPDFAREMIKELRELRETLAQIEAIIVQVATGMGIRVKREAE